jgi:hypothetical protein
LVPHALAPVAELPVLEVVSAVHILADLTLGLGNVVYDYLQDAQSKPHGTRRRSLTWRDNEHVLQSRNVATAGKRSEAPKAARHLAVASQPPAR